MSREEFDQFIQKLETVARQNPRLYRARIIGLVALAYVYLLLILFGSLALCLLMLALIMYVPVFGIMGFIACGGIFLAVLNGLRVKLATPQGQPITRAEAPNFFALLDELQAALDCQPFHKVSLMPDMNAGVVQIPRLGIFGWHQNYLVVGLPLMQIMAPDEFKAVLAHEFAHSSRRHGQFGNWLYRVRRTWAQVFEQMAKRRSRLGAVLFRFLNWFWPVFNGHAFVLARANEYEADACSVRLAGPAAAQALIRLQVDGMLPGEKFWPDLVRRASHEAEAPADAMLTLGQVLKTGPTPDEAAAWMRRAFLTETNNADTHPCLKDRLQAMGSLPAGVEKGIYPERPATPSPNAAEFFLGDYAATAAWKMSGDWKKFMASPWKIRHERAQKITRELAAMEPPADAPPTPAGLWEKALKIIELQGHSAALALSEQIVALEPGHAGANFILGRHYLSLDDARGVAFMETAVTADPSMVQNGCHILHVYFNRTGQRDQLRPLENRFDELKNKPFSVSRNVRTYRRPISFCPPS